MDAQKKIETRLIAIASEKIALETKLDKLRDQINGLELSYDALDAERNELQSALDVLKRFEVNENALPAESVRAASAGKRIVMPPNAPKNVSGMVIAVLSDSLTGKLTALEILADIQQRWLPHLMRTSLSPALSRMKVQGHLIREGHVWHLPQNAETGDAGTSPVSDSQNDIFG